MELADTSAWGWALRTPELRAWLAAQARDGDIATCDMVRLEVLKTARNLDEFRALRADLGRYPDCPIGKPEWTRALEVYEALAAGGGAHQRSVKHADLLIAAAAESAGVPVLHYDEDFDRIAAVTSQPVRWLAPRGSL